MKFLSDFTPTDLITIRDYCTERVNILIHKHTAEELTKNTDYAMYLDCKRIVQEQLDSKVSFLVKIYK